MKTFYPYWAINSGKKNFENFAVNSGVVFFRYGIAYIFSILKSQAVMFRANGRIIGTPSILETNSCSQHFFYFITDVY